MNQDRSHGETFAEFKDSFSYGSRTDLAFKFLKRLSPEDAADTSWQHCGCSKRRKAVVASLSCRNSIAYRG
jgi:hypothetical protein